MEKNENRGSFNNLNYARQLVKFQGLTFERGITPTDIDGLLEFDDKAFVILELKFGNAQMPFGQQLAIERLINAIENGGKPAIGIIAKHNETGDIIAADCEVTQVWIHGKWIKEPYARNVKVVIDDFLMTENIKLNT